MSDELPTPNTPSNDANTTSVGGNVTTGRDFVGRDLTVHGDQVQGDKVAGDKISAGDSGVAAGQITDSVIVTGHNNIIGDGNTVITQRLDPKDAKNQRNHAAMRKLVRKFWIDGVLKSSLYNEVLIRLNLAEQPKAVDNRPWDLILQQPGKPNYDIPPGTPIIDVFDQMNGLLLILGEPGSGKTTTLLELADALLIRAESDPTYPTPVVFNLSSWAEKRQPLTEWLGEELRTKYNIPKKVAQQWIADDELLLLLDGLDEVRHENREDCVQVINQFRQEHFVRLAVCSRLAEYENLVTGLRLQGAILVQSLTLAQIDEYLNTAGNELSAVRVALHEDTELQEMATTPLLLSVMVIAYEGVSTLLLPIDSPLSSYRKHVFDAYIRRLFVHRGIPPLYPINRTVAWLSWLATKMSEHQQTIFLIEKLQPDWLKISALIKLYRMHVGLCFGLTMSIFLILSAGQILPLTTGRTVGLSEGLLVGLLLSLMEGVFFYGLGDWWGDKQASYMMDITPVVQLKFNWLAGIGVGLYMGGWVWLKEGRDIGLIVGLGMMLLAGISVGSSKWSQITAAPNTIYPNYGFRDTIRNMLFGGFVTGFVGGIAGGLFLWPDGILGGILGFFPLGGLAGGGLVCIQHIVLRIILWVNNYIPFDYASFLDYSHSLVFLRKVGGGYVFVHRLLLEHFAAMTDDDIKRLAAEVEASRS